MASKRITPQIMYGVVGEGNDFPWSSTMTYVRAKADVYCQYIAGSRVACLRVTEIAMPEDRKPRAKKGAKRGKAK